MTNLLVAQSIQLNENHTYNHTVPLHIKASHIYNLTGFGHNFFRHYLWLSSRS
ncbi:hypothetical protein Hanom_Chr11g01032861 [Helianthus anomalus]